MFSNITEAWSHDPVKEMTNRLSNGTFDGNGAAYGEIFKNKPQINDPNAKTQYPLINVKSLSKNTQSKNTLSKHTQSKHVAPLSDINSISLLSDDVLIDDQSDFGPFAPVNFDKYSILKNNKKHYHKNFSKNNNRKKNYIMKNYHLMDDTDTSDIMTEDSHPSKCMFSMRHLKNCDNCYGKLKYLIDAKVNKKFDEMILENKMKQLQAMTAPIYSQQSNVQSNNNTKSDSWKEILIIVIGTVIAIFIIFLIVKTLQK